MMPVEIVPVSPRRTMGSKVVLFFFFFVIVNLSRRDVWLRIRICACCRCTALVKGNPAVTRLVCLCACLLLRLCSFLYVVFVVELRVFSCICSRISICYGTFSVDAFVNFCIYFLCTFIAIFVCLVLRRCTTILDIVTFDRDRHTTMVRQRP